MKDKPPPDSIQRTADLMRALVAVPKAEIDDKAREYARKRPKRRKR